MAKFNVSGVKPQVTSAVRTEETPSGRTHQGGAGFARDAKSELFLLAVTNMVGEKTFYESADDRDERFERLVHEVAVSDPQWMGRFIPWLRGEANMRSASLVAAAEFVKARLDAGAKVKDDLREHHGVGLSRAVVAAALQRPDEPGEMLAYWTGRHGRRVPQPVKRGVADAVERLYTERALLKYDGVGNAFRFGDVIDLVHPRSDRLWQGLLYQHALDRRHNRDREVPATLGTVRNNAYLRGLDDPAAWLNPQRLADAGMTWEDALSAVGSKVDKAKLWEAVIPSMGYMALLRNLRNFDQAGVSDEAAAKVVAKLADRDEVARSRQFPFRFLSAYNAVSHLRWAYPLEQALNYSLANVPVLAGRTLVLVDRSGSMFGPLSERTKLNRADSAALFGAALALRAQNSTLVEFGTHYREVDFDRGESVLHLLGKFTSMGGTNTQQAVSATYRAHDRVVILTDEQAAYSGYGDVTASVPKTVPVYTWNLAGYRTGHAPSGSGNRHTFGGLVDAAFKLIPLLEAGTDSGWPF
jgi:hypothetical protein